MGKGFYSNITSITTMAEQNERAFQKQSGVFLNTKSLLSAKSKKGVRYYKNVGLGFKTPKEAVEGTYVDNKCPFTGNVSIRGRILKYAFTPNTYSTPENLQFPEIPNDLKILRQNNFPFEALTMINWDNL